MGRAARLSVAMVLAATLGCVHVPPGRVAEDRFGYSQAIAESWKRQTLINVVRLRYGDAPTFLEVSSVINNYTSLSQVNAGVDALESPDASGLSVGGSHTWSNSPTVTYQPLTGQKFTSSLLRPIDPAAVFRLIEAGWPVRLILQTAVRSVNGVSGQSFGVRPDPEYEVIADALTRIQRSQAMDVRVEEHSAGDAVVVVFRSDSADDSVREDSRRVRELLGLDPDISEFTVAFGSLPRNKSEIALLTRSMFEIMLELAAGVSVPESDITEGRVLFSKAVEQAGLPASPLIRINCGETVPADAFVAVPYRNKWFWIDDTDAISKGKFTFLMILFSMAESAPAGAGPILTVPAGR